MPRPLRIGIVTDGLEERPAATGTEIANGGVGVYIYNLVKHLQAIDRVNEYVLISRGGGNLDIYGDERSRCVRLPRSRCVELGQWIDVPYFLVARRLRLDLLHFPNQLGGGFLPRSFKRVLTVHDLTAFLLPELHPRARVIAQQLLMRRSIRSADHVITVSTHTRTDLQACCAIPVSKTTVIPNGVGATFRPGVSTADFLERYDLPTPFVLTVGVLEPRKNHQTLIRALRRLHACGERIGLVIVGRDGWQWSEPLDAADLRPWVRVVRNAPDADLVEFYNRATLFVYPSLYEGFGLPLLEAMACGTPVVSSTAAALPEVAGGAALLADPTNAEDLADQCLRILRDPRLRRRLVTAGLERARGFSWCATAEATRAVYEQVCARGDH